MKTMNTDSDRLTDLARTLKDRRDNHTLGVQLKQGARDFVDDLLAILFPHFCKELYFNEKEIESRLSLIQRDLKRLLTPLVHSSDLSPAEIAERFAAALPDIHDRLWLDAEAINAGDPAAESVDEVILAYPGFTAIAVYRLAHEFYRMRVPIFPRLLTEYAHTTTSIDIHPGATIGTSFAIDHGTGIVIGESTVIGNNVKIYQGVTLGALSVEKSLARSKRHPTIEDHVVIYAQAVILGGDTVVGHHSVIGGNVWLTHSVPPESIVTQEGEAIVRSRNEPSALTFSI